MILKLGVVVQTWFTKAQRDKRGISQRVLLVGHASHQQDW
jgi:hypothetical protein